MADLNTIGGLHYEMMRRCYNEKSVAYKDYGAKGITVCKEWHDREVFRQWCKENGYQKGLRLERINGSGNYEPSNCKLGKRNAYKNGIGKHSKNIRAHRKEQKELSGVPEKYSNLRIYRIFACIHSRCELETNTHYENYGGRGITVCDEWMDFIPFMNWAYSNGYDENAKRGECTLDRIDANGNYCPENCRWVSMSVQANNKTDNVYLEYNGVTDTLTNHARNLGLDPRTVESRKVKGESIDKIFREKRKTKTIEYKGKTYTVNEFCKKFKVSRSPVETRIFKNGESPEIALRNIRANKKKPMKRNRKVLQYDTDMNFLREWDNINCICKELGLNRSAIGNCCLGNSKSSQGFIWKYK